MEENTARISISVSEGKFEISGSEEFVNKQIENFKELITKSVSQLQTRAAKPRPTTSSSTDNEVVTSNKGDGDTTLHSDIFTVDGEELKIICDLPGSNKKTETLNAALLYAYGRRLQREQTANVEEIREVCSKHGCLVHLENPPS